MNIHTIQKKNCSSPHPKPTTYKGATYYLQPRYLLPTGPLPTTYRPATYYLQGHYLTNFFSRLYSRLVRRMKEPCWGAATP